MRENPVRHGRGEREERTRLGVFEKSKYSRRTSVNTKVIKFHFAVARSKLYAFASSNPAVHYLDSTAGPVILQI